MYLFIFVFIYLFIYLFSLLKFGLHEVKFFFNKINKQTIRFETLLPYLASNIKRVKANQLSSAPPLKPSEHP